MSRPLRRPLALLALSAALPLACADFVEGEASSAGLGTSDGSTTAGSGETGTSTDTSGTTGATTTGTTTTGSTTTDPGTTTTTGVTTVDASTSAGPTGDPTTGDPTGDPTTDDPTTGSTGDPMPACDNQAKDGDESDVDCGGSCPKCQDGQTCVGDGDCESGVCADTCQASAKSCKELLDANPEIGDGIYTIYPDGAPLEIKCDMLGGGWTCLYANDFSNNTDGWSNPANESCAGDKILGRLYNKASTQRQIDLLAVPHAELRVTGNLYVIDSWDNEQVTLKVDDAELWSKSCSIGTCDQQGNLCGSGVWWDVIVPFTATGGHNAATAVVAFSTTLNESKSNESYGVDDIEVCVR